LYHFQVLFGVLSLLKPGTGERCIHLSYGMVRLPEGKMKSREGKVVDADDLMDALHALARAELEGRAADRRAHVEDMTATELDFRAERIAQAALKFFVMRYTPKKSFEYDPKKSIDFTGQTGPYCLYAYARTRSLIRKGGWKPVFDQSLVELLTEDSEQAIIRQLFFFPQVLQRATDGFDPSKIADYSYELASSFARMFTDKQSYPIVTCPDENLKRARLMLAHAVGTVLRAALGLIGISVLEEM
jgi:arginyl-tRNA synthetase